jgi:sulfoxide reductase heme-binding subunit YedZ
VSPDAEASASADSASTVQFGLPVLALLAAVAFALSGAGAHTVWYVVRATGVVAYALVTLTVLGGLLFSNRSLPPGQGRVDIYEAHRFVALLAISAALFHALTLLLDTYIGFTPTQIVVPFTSTYRPLAVALGIMALYISMAVYLSFYLKRWIGYASWRAIHYASFVVFALASYHGILSGADTSKPWMLAIYLVPIATVLCLILYRIVKAGEAADAQATAHLAPSLARDAKRTLPAPTFERETALPDIAWRRPTRG